MKHSVSGARNDIRKGESCKIRCIRYPHYRLLPWDTVVHDRPMKTELGEYKYLMECTDCDYQTYLLLEKKSAMKFRYLGSFDEK